VSVDAQTRFSSARLLYGPIPGPARDHWEGYEVRLADFRAG